MPLLIPAALSPPDHNFFVQEKSAAETEGKGVRLMGLLCIPFFGRRLASGRHFR